MTKLYEGFMKYHIDKSESAFKKLFDAELEVIETHKEEWAQMNYLIENGMWNEKAVFLADAYGLNVGEEMYVFQLNAPLPFLPNPYYMRFKQNKEEFAAARLLISFHLLDVMAQLKVELMSQPAALMIRHHYSSKTKRFDMDNKAKQVLINSFQGKLIEDDSVQNFSYYSERAIKDTEDRTMLYVCLEPDWLFMEQEIIPKYPRIDHLSNVVVGKYPDGFLGKCPRGEDSPSGKNSGKRAIKTDQEQGLDGNFM